MPQEIKKVLVTGAAGQIAYSLCPLIANGGIYGPNVSIHLVLLDISQMMGIVEGVAMELDDCAFSNLVKVTSTDKVEEAFDQIDAAFLVGAMPRKEGMQRSDLLKSNVRIFKEQGQTLDKFAKKTCKVLVVGNPANTNALFCSKYAPSIPKENITAMTRLDQNRANAQVGLKANLPVKSVRNVIIWGNHSSTQFPDARFAEVSQDDGKTFAPLSTILTDESFLKNELVEVVQKRGAAVIAARKLSSAMSAARAAAAHMRDWVLGTKEGEIVSMGVITTGSNQTYGVEDNLVFSFPCKCKNGKWEIVNGLPIDEFAKNKLQATEEELRNERDDATAACKD